MDKTQIDRLIRLANCLAELPDEIVVRRDEVESASGIDLALDWLREHGENERPQRFNMRYLRGQSECGTACCALGWGLWLWSAESNVVIESYELTALNLYGFPAMSEQWTWLFSCFWEHTEWNTPKDAARRIYWLLSGGRLEYHDMSHVPDLKTCRNLPMGITCSSTSDQSVE